MSLPNGEELLHNGQRSVLREQRHNCRRNQKHATGQVTTVAGAVIMNASAANATGCAEVTYSTTGADAQIQSLPRSGFQHLSVELFQLLHRMLIHGVKHVKYTKTLLAQNGRRGHDSDAHATEVINVVQPSFHAVDVHFKLNCTSPDLEVMSLKFSEFRSVGGVLMDPNLKHLPNCSKNSSVIHLLGNFCKHFQTLHGKIHLDHAQDLVLLQSRPRDVDPPKLLLLFLRTRRPFADAIGIVAIGWVTTG